MEIVPPVPKCGSSDARNAEYLKNYTPRKFFTSLVETDEPVVFDVGAHRGESVMFFTSIFPRATVYSFEPEPDNFSELQRVSAPLKSHAFNLAIGEQDTRAAYYRQDVSHLGGLLPIKADSRDSLGYASRAKNEIIEVDTRSLDSFCQEHQVNHIDILKIDVQGAEAAVLRGARETLRKTTCVMVEVALYDFFAGEASGLLLVEQAMCAAGFSVWDISKVSKNPKNLRTDWVELVYGRR